MSDMEINDGIIQADIEALIATNVLAAEQLRRIVAERLVRELRLQLSNGTASVDALDAPTAVIAEG